jgi:hypothetical protein
MKLEGRTYRKDLHGKLGTKQEFGTADQIMGNHMHRQSRTVAREGRHRVARASRPYPNLGNGTHINSALR